MAAEVGESESERSLAVKTVFVRVKRKPEQSPLEAFWLEINERPLKKKKKEKKPSLPFSLDFDKLTLSDSDYSSPHPPPQASVSSTTSRVVLVQHVETVSTSQAALDLLHSFVQPTTSCDADAKSKLLTTSAKHRKRLLQNDTKHDQLLSKAKQDHKDLAESARFQQIWDRRNRNKSVFHDEALDQVFRVYDVMRVDGEEATTSAKQPERISGEDQDVISKFLPLLRECVPGAAEDIESDFRNQALCQGPSDEYVYDVYAVDENVEETESPYPFPLVQVDDDEEFYDGSDDSDYETDDSNAEGNPRNDYPDEESTEDDEEGSEGTRSGSEEDESESENDKWTDLDELEFVDGSEDPLHEFEMNDRASYTDVDEGED